jgi:hypothetical protein
MQATCNQPEAGKDRHRRGCKPTEAGTTTQAGQLCMAIRLTMQTTHVKSTRKEYAVVVNRLKPEQPRRLVSFAWPFD